MKQCRSCAAVLPHEDFNRCAKAPDGRQAWCRECQHDHNHHYHRAGLRDARPDKGRLERFQLTNEQVDRRVANQGGCAICKTSRAKWTVDHDHGCCSGRRSCGRCVRGVLCTPCNWHLGLYERGCRNTPLDPMWRCQAAAYLLRMAHR